MCAWSESDTCRLWDVIHSHNTCERQTRLPTRDMKYFEEKNETNEREKKIVECSSFLYVCVSECASGCFRFLNKMIAHCVSAEWAGVENWLTEISYSGFLPVLCL